MFVCRECHTVAYGSPVCAFSASYGPCEMCRKYSSCGDCQCGKRKQRDMGTSAEGDFQQAIRGLSVLLSDGNAELARVTAERDALRTDLAEARRQGASDLKLAGHIDDARAVIVAENEKLKAALTEVMGLLDSGELVRDISRDGEPGWPIRMMRVVGTLARAAKLVTPEPPAQAGALRLPSQDICVPLAPDPPEEAGP